MSVTDALATSPNTAFAKLISQVGVSRTVDMAIKLGLRSYANPAPPATTTRTATRVWPTSSSARTSVPSPWARSRSTRWNCPTSRPPWPRVACGAHPTRSTS
ncbi:putative penicillin-binding domain protein [Mycobacterium ulcerans str. Harvey]|uniref:Penicillin-binding domain protein n=1 Tax=Mycobacterium ulcerans str. Harvey TaxID=1299332 RepID=A0ABN0QPB7_MYCUL|nr:putative penicillin-binding domain protein [Mycobacterium ulcerans str. Harvey]